VNESLKGSEVSDVSWAGFWELQKSS
jgi:hypothetical protein